MPGASEQDGVGDGDEPSACAPPTQAVAALHRDMTLLQLSRSFERFARLLGLNVLLMGASVAVKQLLQLLLDRAATRWRASLTAQLHEDYFSAMNYYHVAHTSRTSSGGLCLDARRWTPPSYQTSITRVGGPTRALGSRVWCS